MSNINLSLSEHYAATVVVSLSLGFSPIPKHGSSFAISALNLGWDTA